MIFLINLLLFAVRCVQLDFGGFCPCWVNGRKVDLWDLKPDDVFTMEGREGRFVVLSWPVVYWSQGCWAVMTVQDFEYEEYAAQRSIASGGEV